MPDSVYARLETPTGYAPGIAFCGKCRPELGDVVLHGYGPVVAVEAAHHRYHEWFTPDHGEFRRAWLRDALSLDLAYIDALMQRWESDRPRVILG